LFRRITLYYDELLSSFVSNVKVRPYSTVTSNQSYAGTDGVVFVTVKGPKGEFTRKLEVGTSGESPRHPPVDKPSFIELDYII
jgi:hypothetical protein